MNLADLSVFYLTKTISINSRRAFKFLLLIYRVINFKNLMFISILKSWNSSTPAKWAKMISKGATRTRLIIELELIIELDHELIIDLN